MMKTQNIRRNIRSSSEGAAQDVPKLGRVTRLRGPNRANGIDPVIRRGRKARQRAAWIWSLALASVALVVILVFSAVYMRSHKGGVVIADSARRPENVRIASRFPSPGEDEALALVKRAVANRDPGMVGMYMHRRETDAAKVVEFMAGLEARDGRIERMSWLGSMDVEGMLIDGVLLACAGKGTPIERLAFLVPDEAGVWKVDFEAFARTSTPTWKDFMEGRAERAEVRVLVARDSYFNGPFGDESQWGCFALAAPDAKQWLSDGEELLRGYCRKGSPQSKALERMFRDGARMRRATLEILRTKGAEARQFEITRVLSEDWVLPARPFDEKFN
jgi:hypothetical protein